MTVDNNKDSWIGAAEVARRLGMTRSMVHRLDAILAPEWDRSTRRHRKVYFATHVDRIVRQRSIASAEADALRTAKRPTPDKE